MHHRKLRLVVGGSENVLELELPYLRTPINSVTNPSLGAFRSRRWTRLVYPKFEGEHVYCISERGKSRASYGSRAS
jgi:hypothetical protein